MTAAVAVRERPLLMSAPMVRAILDDRKSQTRRAMKPQPTIKSLGGVVDIAEWNYRKDATCAWSMNLEPGFALAHCPYGQPGDRLWVRETWGAEFRWPMPDHSEFRQWSKMPSANRLPGDDAFVAFRATETVHACAGNGVDRNACANARSGRWEWKPSIHMPRWVSRITLELTDVRVERVQDISEEDAAAEGVAEWARVAMGEPDLYTAREQYEYLWNELNAPRGYGWDGNPWVWVLSFRRVDS